ncbi:MAG: M15 family metallopeptidase [Candidatus Eremiobacterota bacterium]
MSKVRSSTSRSSSSSSMKGLSGKGAAKVGGGGKAGKSARVKSGLGKVSGGKSTKAGGSKSVKGKTGRHKSQKASEMQNPFKQLGNFLGNVLGTDGKSGGVKGASGKKSGSGSSAGRSGSAGKSRSTGRSSGAGKSRSTGRSSGAGKSHGTGKTGSAGKSQKTGGTAAAHKTGSKDSVKKSQSETGQVKGQEKPSTGEGGKVMGTAKGTGYYPHNSKMEGGYLDKKGNKLTTLQDVLDGKAKSAAIALDKNLYKSGQVKYGDSFTIPEMDKKYGRHIDFRAVDTGGAFTGKGFSRVDICTGSKKDSLDPTVNGKLTLIKNPDALKEQGQKAGAQAEVKAAEQSKKPDTGQLPPGAKVEGAKDTGAQQPGKIPGDTLGTTPPRGRAAIEKMFGPAGKNQVNVKMPAGPGGKMINVKCNEKIAPKLNAVFQEIKDKGLSGEIKANDGCYNYRTKRNGKSLSTHSWGIAMDINAGSHPMGSSKQTAGQKAIAEIFQKHGFYQLPNDPMHFQFARGY